jgi:hypothetical protein
MISIINLNNSPAILPSAAFAAEQQSQQQRQYHTCNKACGQEILFDANHSKSQSGKYIPLDKKTGTPHQCQQ